MNSAFSRWSKEDGYQKRLSIVRANVLCRTKVPRFVAIGLSSLSKNLGSLYLISALAWWSLKFHFEALLQKRQKLFVGWQNAELFNMRVFERAKCYCPLLELWVRYMAPTLLFVSTLLVISCCSWLALRRSAHDHARSWAMPLAECVVMTALCSLLTPGTECVSVLHV